MCRPVSLKIKQQCEQRLKQLFEHAVSHINSQNQTLPTNGQTASGFLKKLRARPWQNHELKEPTIVFTQRGKIAGSALLQKNMIKLHPTLLEENLDYFLSDVIAHELSHLLVYQLFGMHRGLLRRTRVKPHGIEWQKMMQEVFKLSPKVTHSLNVKNIGMKHFDYTCTCQTVAFSLIRHNKVIRGKQVYYCKRCKQSFKPAC